MPQKRGQGETCEVTDVLLPIVFGLLNGSLNGRVQRGSRYLLFKDP